MIFPDQKMNEVMHTALEKEVGGWENVQVVYSDSEDSDSLL